MKLKRYILLIVGAFLGLSARMANAQSCSACGWNGASAQCYSVPTGIVGNTGCANRYDGGCDYWGGSCSNGQQGPPTAGAWCTFNPTDSSCQGDVFNKNYQIACLPSLKDELFGSIPVPGRSIRLIRTPAGALVRFEHAL